MYEVDFREVNEVLNGAGIPSTYEYPGYISVYYRSYEITFGVDANELSSQTHVAEGSSDVIPGDYDMALNNSNEGLVALTIQKWLAERYKVIDLWIKVHGYRKD